VLRLDAATGVPVGMNYTANTARSPAASGTIESVSLDVRDVERPASICAYLMVDACPAAVQTLE